MGKAISSQRRRALLAYVRGFYEEHGRYPSYGKAGGHAGISPMTAKAYMHAYGLVNKPAKG